MCVVSGVSMYHRNQVETGALAFVGDREPTAADKRASASELRLLSRPARLTSPALFAAADTIASAHTSAPVPKLCISSYRPRFDMRSANERKCLSNTDSTEGLLFSGSDWGRVRKSEAIALGEVCGTCLQCNQGSTCCLAAQSFDCRRHR